MKTIAFHVENFTFRGTEVVNFDYAFYNQTICKNKSIILSPKNKNYNASEVEEVKNKFLSHFQVFFYNDIDLEKICIDNKVDLFYVIKYGKQDNLVLKTIPTFVHCVFTTNEPHGTFYVGVSDSVSKNNSKNIKYPVLNHIVYLPSLQTNYRKELNIPQDALVLGRHGGNDTFNIPFVKDGLLELLNEKQNLYLIFCVQPAIFNDIKHPRIIYLQPFSDTRIKRKFINTCDAMIHACSLGESFGLSVLEFAFCGKPVITWNGGSWHQQHLSNLGDKAIKYNNKEELKHIILNFQEVIKNKDFYINNFSPEKIMNDFEKLIY